MAIAPPVLQEHDGIMVVRDDLVAGGTKVRALPVLMRNGASEFVYASPVYGYAQIALAIAARDRGGRATIFCAARAQKHQRTKEAEANGAKIVEVEFGRMNVVQARAREYCGKTGAAWMPFGLDTPSFLEALSDVAAAIPYSPKEVWCAAGSGVLTRALQMAWPLAKHYAVRVGAVPDAGHAKVLVAPEKFEQDAEQKPPFPSCSNYDSKAWRFVKRMAKPGALCWNVAG